MAPHCKQQRLVGMKMWFGDFLMPVRMQRRARMGNSDLYCKLQLYWEHRDSALVAGQKVLMSETETSMGKLLSIAPHIKDMTLLSNFFWIRGPRPMSRTDEAELLSDWLPVTAMRNYLQCCLREELRLI